MNLDFYDNRTTAYCDECTLPVTRCECENLMSKRRIGLSKTRPTSEVVQGPPSRGRHHPLSNREARRAAELGIVIPSEPISARTAVANAAFDTLQKEIFGANAESTCTEPSPTIDSSHPAIMPQPKGQNMILTLKGLDKRGRNAIYTGLATAIRVPIGAFAEKQPLPTFEVEGAFAEKRQPKAKMTAEERKAARAAAPKLTAAEKLARLDKRREKLLAEATAPDQPSL